MNADKYGDLLAHVRPTLPRSVSENRRLLDIVGPLLDKDSLSPEEAALTELLVTLIHRFEQDHYKPERSEPHEVLAYLMEQHNLRQRDLLDIFPSRSRVSEVLSGKRVITKGQAVLLAKRFAVHPSLFVTLRDPQAP
jgi:HTH-type transcriptional regulator / antitoxin HigA